MADLAKSAVTVLDSWRSARSGRTDTVRRYSLVLTGQGTATNKITAAVLGFAILHGAGVGITDDDGHLVVASPSADGSHLLLKDSATDAPADLTGTLIIEVSGQ